MSARNRRNNQRRSPATGRHNRVLNQRTNTPKSGRAARTTPSPRVPTPAPTNTKKEEPKPETETKNTKTETKNTKTETKNTKTETKNTKTETKNTKPTKNEEKTKDTPKHEEESWSRDDSVVSIAELKRACKAYGIKGYSKKKKQEIVEMLTSSYGDDEAVQKMALLVKNVKNLKKICFSLGIKGYSKKKKKQLVDLICRTKKEKANIKAELEEAISNLDSLPWVSEEAILKSYDYLVLRNYDITITDLVEALDKNEAKLQKDFVRIIAKRTRKSFDVKNKSNK